MLSAEDFKAGDKVQHEVLGRGTVSAIDTSHLGTMVRVTFDRRDSTGRNTYGCFGDASFKANPGVIRKLEASPAEK